ncbi:hypothetical protein ACN38_g12141 [Penicillium nordicum]|uniref:Uncharacterized protein n=1 Tax=Penicillium nordicum TaxID=229535 RepID=A0A0M9WA41_9EURO|nr:hypothetical protein ACN38_g12141 [Penicillium nordicum]
MHRVRRVGQYWASANEILVPLWSTWLFPINQLCLLGTSLSTRPPFHVSYRVFLELFKTIRFFLQFNHV